MELNKLATGLKGINKPKLVASAGLTVSDIKYGAPLVTSFYDIATESLLATKVFKKAKRRVMYSSTYYIENLAGRYNIGEIQVLPWNFTKRIVWDNGIPFLGINDCIIGSIYIGDHKLISSIPSVIYYHQSKIKYSLLRELSKYIMYQRPPSVYYLNELPVVIRTLGTILEIANHLYEKYTPEVKIKKSIVSKIKSVTGRSQYSKIKDPFLYVYRLKKHLGTRTDYDISLARKWGTISFPEYLDVAEVFLMSINKEQERRKIREQKIKLLTKTNKNRFLRH